MRHVLVQVCKNQQEFEHAVALVGIRFGCAFFEILDDRKGIGEQPFQRFGIYRKPAPATVKSLAGTQERFVHEMIQTKLLARERERNRLGTLGPLAISGSADVHDTPTPLGTVGRSEAGARLT